ncbi:hypothetical protein KDA11_04730, partial [Candidatus Saccharibacteria bacterium]|nr:hypothetical protein [Candidatus Saccharibacteria bacterium]
MASTGEETVFQFVHTSGVTTFQSKDLKALGKAYAHPVTEDGIYVVDNATGIILPPSMCVGLTEEIACEYISDNEKIINLIPVERITPKIFGTWVMKKYTDYNDYIGGKNYKLFKTFINKSDDCLHEATKASYKICVCSALANNDADTLAKVLNYKPDKPLPSAFWRCLRFKVPSEHISPYINALPKSICNASQDIETRYLLEELFAKYLYEKHKSLFRLIIDSWIADRPQAKQLIQKIFDYSNDLGHRLIRD